MSQALKKTAIAPENHHQLPDWTEKSNEITELFEKIEQMQNHLNRLKQRPVLQFTQHCPMSINASTVNKQLQNENASLSANFGALKALVIGIIALFCCVIIVICYLWYRSYRNSQNDRIQQMRQCVKKNASGKNVEVSEQIKGAEETTKTEFSEEKFSDVLEMIQNVVFDDIVNDM